MIRRFALVGFSRTRWLLGASLVIGIVWGVRHWASHEGAVAVPPRPQTQPAAQSKAAQPKEKKQPIVALVNGQTITHDEIAQECLRHHGKEVLESLVNRHLVANHCREQDVSVTQQEIDMEIDRIARKFSLPKEQYLKMLEKERDIQPAQYGEDIIWPTLALRKIAAPQLTVSPQELEDAYESQFGRAVKARLIVLNDEPKAKQVLAEVRQKPEEFGALARKYSQDVNSASANGLIQPIRRHLGDPKIEEISFQLQPGEISPVIPVGNQFAILLCEGFLEPVAANREKFDAIMTESIKERKLRAAASETFKYLQENAKVVNVMNDPELSRKMPGVAATVNGQPITLAELANACAERHGKEVLEGVINRCLLNQTLQRKKLQVTQDDVNAEVARAAVAMGKVLANNQPDIDGWLELVQQNQGINEETYLRDVVWPSTAMKKIVGNSVKVTDEDMRKGFEANYGPRVRCRVVVCNNQRKAQEVWDLARRNPTIKNFGDLAEQYSIEANSRSLRGEMTPLQRWGGQPVLEEHAFKLQPGEISPVIQVGENHVVLFCEGYTKPVEVDAKTVQEQLYTDILEKKQRLEMAKVFEEIKAAATIDNYLAGTTQSPKREKDLLAEDALEQPRARNTRKPEMARGIPKR